MNVRAIGLAVTVVTVVLGFGSSAPMAAEAAGPGTWTAAGDMPVARYAHTLTLLPNGRVLMTGGSGIFDVYNETALYNRATNTWTPVAPMFYPRTAHTATLLRDGRVLVAGGWILSGDTKAVEIYNPFSNTWTLAASMNHVRVEHTATLLTDGRVLVTGGSTNPGVPDATASAEIYDPILNTWTPIPDMAAPQVGHTAVLLPDGRVLTVGDGSAQLYDPGPNTWAAPTPYPSAGAFPEAVRLPDGRVLVVDGATSLYDPGTNTWAAGPPPLVITDTFHSTLTLLGNGRVLRAGTSPAPFSASTEEFDPGTMTWLPRGSMSAGRSWHAAVLLPSGEVLVAGGEGYCCGTTATAELYDATSWVPAASPAAPRLKHTATLLWSGKVLVAGGGSAAAELYDELTNTWSPASTMSAPRELHAAARMNDGRILVVGGTDGPYTGSNNLLTAEIYNPNTNSWSGTAPPTLSHVGGSAVVLPGGRVFVYGGVVGPQPEIYNPATNTWTLGAVNSNTLVLPDRGAFRTATGRVVSLDIGASNLYDPTADTWTPLSYGGPFGPGAGALLEGSPKIVVAGGNLQCFPFHLSSTTDVVIFDSVTEAWTNGSPLATSRSVHTASALYDGKLLVAGGAHSESFCSFLPSNAVASAELYDASSNMWTSAGTMTTPRHSHLATLLPSGNVLIVGGKDDTAVLITAERYDLGIHTDTDGDGYSDGLELALGQHPWLNCKTMRADVSGDGIVNVADLGRVASKVGVRPPPSRIDQNGDKIVNVADLGLVASKSGQSVLGCA